MERRPGTPRRKMQTIRNERGLMTLDFIFALMMCFGFSVVFFAVAITLSMVEVTQYVAFASARSFASAHVSEAEQIASGNAKYQQLLQNKVFKGLYGLGWIKIDPPGSTVVGDYNNQYADYQSPSDDNDIFTGSQIKFNSKIMNLQIPFLGATAEGSSTGQATISAYLIREISTQECQTVFTTNRYTKLRGLRSEYQPPVAADAALVTDNGC